MHRFTTLYSTVINRFRLERRERRSLHHFTETIGRVEWIVFGTESAAAIVVPRGLKNESWLEWISGGIMPSHFRFYSMVEFIEPPTWTAFPFVIISGRVNRAQYQFNMNSKIIFILTNHPKTLPSNIFLFFLRYNRHSLNLKSTRISCYCNSNCSSSKIHVTRIGNIGL